MGAERGCGKKISLVDRHHAADLPERIRLHLPGGELTAREVNREGFPAERRRDDRGETQSQEMAPEYIL
jgi:hypothetical protein